MQDVNSSIYEEINDIARGKYDKNNNVLKNAPHTAAYVSSDEWSNSYSRELAAYPEVVDQRKAALEYTGSLIESISAIVDGLYFISPLNKWDIALEFVRQVREGEWKGSGRADRYCLDTVNQ